MQTMEAVARSQGWTAQAYPEDIRAGFLAESIRQAPGTSEINYAEIYSRQVTEGSAYLIVSRSEPLFGSKLPPRYSCQIRVFEYEDELPKDAMSNALGTQPVEPWKDEHANEVINWYYPKNFPNRKFQLSRAVSKTSLAGPADISGLAISSEISGER